MQTWVISNRTCTMWVRVREGKRVKNIWKKCPYLFWYQQWKGILNSEYKNISCTDGLMQANTLELCLFCTNPSIPCPHSWATGHLLWVFKCNMTALYQPHTAFPVSLSVLHCQGVALEIVFVIFDSWLMMSSMFSWGLVSDWTLRTIDCHETSSIICTKLKNINVSHIIPQLSLPNPLKPGVKSRKNLKLEQHLQERLQLHLSD